jgi:hypothetical protein
MAERQKQACPVVRAAAGLDCHERRWELLEISDHLGSSKLASDDHNLILIDAVKLEHRL